MDHIRRHPKLRGGVPLLTARESRARVNELRRAGYTVERVHVPGLGVVVLKSKKRKAGGKCRKYAGVKDFGDPATCSYPLDTPGRARDAMSRLSGEVNKGNVGPKKAAAIRRRILAAYKRFGIAPGG